MKKAARDLTILYTRMLHVTCFAHALHRVADFIRDKFKKLDSLINCGKKIFLKAPSRIRVLKTQFPNLSLPPAPVITRWGTWLKAVSYYAENWNSIQAVIDSLPASDASAIKQAQELFKDPKVFEEVTFVHQHYTFLADCINKLETDGQTIKEQLDILSTVLNKMTTTPNADIKKKLQQVLDDNPGLSAINAINSNDIEKLRTFSQFKDMSPADICNFTYAPLVSCEVERSFSRYKRVLASHRRNFIFPNLMHYIVVECNAGFFNEEANDEYDF